MMMPFMSLTSYRRGAQAAESPEEGTDTAAALVGAMEAACEERRKHQRVKSAKTCVIW